MWEVTAILEAVFIAGCLLVIWAQRVEACALFQEKQDLENEMWLAGMPRLGEQVEGDDDVDEVV